MQFKPVNFWLMGTDYCNYFIHHEEIVGDLGSVEYGAPSRLVKLKLINRLGLVIADRIRPENIVEQRTDQRLPKSIDLVQVFQFLELRGKTAMDHQEFLCDYACKWESVKAFNEDIVELLIILVQDFLSKCVVCGHGPTLMIAPQNDHLVRIVNLECKESQNDFHAKHPPIHIIAHKDQI